MKILRINEFELSKEEIEISRLFSVFVFGLPRSGTSMMTRIVELLGVNMIHTSEDNKEKTKKRFKKKFGDYHANPNGFFEVTEDFTKHYLKVVSTPYSGCKMIVPVCNHRFDWVKMYPSKVILMLRDPEEIRQSQMAYFRRDNIKIEKIRTSLAMEKVKLRENNIDSIFVNYRGVLEDTINVVTYIKEFIKSDKDIVDAVNFVKPNQIRYKKEELVPGL